MLLRGLNWSDKSFVGCDGAAAAASDAAGAVQAAAASTVGAVDIHIRAHVCADVLSGAVIHWII